MTMTTFVIIKLAQAAIIGIGGGWAGLHYAKKEREERQERARRRAARKAARRVSMEQG